MTDTFRRDSDLKRLIAKLKEPVTARELHTPERSERLRKLIGLPEEKKPAEGWLDRMKQESKDRPRTFVEELRHRKKKK